MASGIRVMNLNDMGNIVGEDLSNESDLYTKIIANPPSYLNGTFYIGYSFDNWNVVQYYNNSDNGGFSFYDGGLDMSYYCGLKIIVTLNSELKTSGTEDNVWQIVE